MKNNILFVIGPGRSGTTLLRSLLDNHEELLLWPFEFNLYDLINKIVKKKDLNRKIKIKDYFYYLKDHFNNLEGEYSADLGKKKYKIINFNFRKFINKFVNNPNSFTTREFIFFLRDAYLDCLEKKPKNIKYFIIFHNEPSEYILRDFPNNKVILTIRNPIDTYISTKKYYFKSCINTGKDCSAVYRPYSANSKFKTLLETSIVPTVYVDNWLNTYKPKNILKIKLEDLKNNSNLIIEKICNFLNIEKNKSLFETTFLGQKHYSNLSEYENTKNTIIKNYTYFKTKKELTIYELIWLKNILKNKKIFGEYTIQDKHLNKNIFNFFKLLKNELPNLSNEKIVDNKFKYIFRLFLRLFIFPINFVLNRYVMLTYDYSILLKKWPINIK